MIQSLLVGFEVGKGVVNKVLSSSRVSPRSILLVEYNGSCDPECKRFGEEVCSRFNGSRKVDSTEPLAPTDAHYPFK
jgi:hypothetical protein